MSPQRMAGYVPLRGAPAETEPAPATTTAPAPAAPAAGAVPEAVPAPVSDVAAPRVPASDVPVVDAPAAVPAAEAPAAPAPVPASDLTPLASRQRMAGYVPLAREAEWLGGAAAPAAAPVSGTPAGAPAAAPAPIAASASPTQSPRPAEPAAAQPRLAEQDVAAAVARPAAAAPVAVESDLVPLGQRRRMGGYVPLAREGEWFAELAAADAAPAGETAEPTVLEAAHDDAAPAAEAAVTEPAAPTTTAAAAAATTAAAQAPAAPVQPATAAAAAPTAPDTRSAPPASAAQPPRAEPAAASGRPARATKKTDAAEEAPASSRLRKALPLVAGVVVLALVAVLAARWLRTLDPVADFIAAYDGHPALAEGTPVGMPPWLGWQHFLNMFLMVLIIRTGLQIRNETRPPANFTPKKDGVFSARGNTPKKFSLTIWTHQALDALWLLNGVVFVVLLFVTGQWARIVPTDPYVFHHALSAGIQYLSLDWPTENGWVHYNALQMLSYTLVVFVAAPLAALTGWRMSSWFPTEAKGLNRAFPMEAARKVHFPVMLFFVLFILTHVFLVFFTGALKNLNHMYTSRGDATDAWGLVVFLVSVAVTAAAWFLLRPSFTAPAASKFGTVGR
ncbi:cytochrome b/b6 domain-containing protein [Micrococcus endophyticus]|uniref:cytochrome b/b6 domain-containing protein n=1 Tax=Micrococcus endophyticus TaxID=455343 RepID=UPI0037F54735